MCGCIIFIEGWKNKNASLHCAKLDCAPSVVLFLLCPPSVSVPHGWRTQGEMRQSWVLRKPVLYSPLYLHKHTQHMLSKDTVGLYVCVCVCVIERVRFALPLILLLQSGVALNVLPLTIQSHITQTVLFNSLSHWEDKYHSSPSHCIHTHTHTHLSLLSPLYIYCLSPSVLSLSSSAAHTFLSPLLLSWSVFPIHTARCSWQSQKQVIMHESAHLFINIYRWPYLLGKVP